MLGSLFGYAYLRKGFKGAAKWAKKGKSATMMEKVYDQTGPLWTKLLPGYGPLASVARTGKMLKTSFKRKGLQRKVTSKIRKGLKDGKIGEEAANAISQIGEIGDDALAAKAQKIKGGVTLDKISKWKKADDKNLQILGAAMDDWVGSIRKGKFKQSDEYVRSALQSKGINYTGKLNLKSGAEKAWNSLNQGKQARRLLQGPSLAANMAVMSIPTMGGISTTAGMIKAAKKRSESAYKGYGGNVRGPGPGPV